MQEDDQPVVCIMRTRSGTCQGILIALQTESNPVETLEQIAKENAALYSSAVVSSAHGKSLDLSELRTYLIKMDPEDSDINLKVFCGEEDGIPITTLRGSKGEFPMIYWRSNRFSDSGYNPAYRCENVSTRIHNAYQSGDFQDLVPDAVNGETVICYSQNLDGPCSGIIFTLEPDENPDAVVSEFEYLVDISKSTSDGTTIDINNSGLLGRPR